MTLNSGQCSMGAEQTVQNPMEGLRILQIFCLIFTLDKRVQQHQRIEADSSFEISNFKFKTSGFWWERRKQNVEFLLQIFHIKFTSPR